MKIIKFDFRTNFVFGFKEEGNENDNFMFFFMRKRTKEKINSNNNFIDIKDYFLVI